jgi:hypothetical protein
MPDPAELRRSRTLAGGFDQHRYGLSLPDFLAI